MQSDAVALGSSRTYELIGLSPGACFSVHWSYSLRFILAVTSGGEGLPNCDPLGPMSTDPPQSLTAKKCPPLWPKLGFSLSLGL